MSAIALDNRNVFEFGFPIEDDAIKSTPSKVANVTFEFVMEFPVQEIFEAVAKADAKDIETIKSRLDEPTISLKEFLAKK